MTVETTNNKPKRRSWMKLLKKSKRPSEEKKSSCSKMQSSSVAAKSALAPAEAQHSELNLTPTSVASSTLSFINQQEEELPCLETSEKFQAPQSGNETNANNNANKNDDMYGYGDATPDDKSKYGYGDAAPNDKAMYGYGDATPDDKAKYGYGDAAPSISSQRRSTPRRSSMKVSGRPRRASIQHVGEIENILPAGQRVRRRTSISFDNAVRVKEVTPADRLTDQPEDLWFQHAEFDRMKKKCYEIVDKVDHGQTGGKKYCVRGLERLMNNTREQVLDRKYNAWDSVLDEQDQQRDSGTYNEEHLASVYKKSTVENAQDAAARALQDEADIEHYLRTARRHCRRLSM